ncbi:MAG: acylphosphatase [Lachnospiraceae bacterium]|nr:acylphosphatase [Lachnospiraceae bacterium]
MTRKRYTFTGWVQGVGFRYSAKYLAERMDITGWVKNEWDGSVVMEAQGDAQALSEFVDQLAGRRFVRIEDIRQENIPVESEYGFHIR